jgi:hypothetical protein
MVYYGTDISEHIVFHAAGASDDKHFIVMTKHSDVPAFTIGCCCDHEWRYDFWMNNNSDYERVKFNIMETIFECEDMDALLVVLSEIFEDGFSDILIKDNECDCDCNCKD